MNFFFSKIKAGNFICPATNQILRSSDQIPNHTLKKMIQQRIFLIVTIIISS
jgi:hypothetical protein